MRKAKVLWEYIKKRYVVILKYDKRALRLLKEYVDVQCPEFEDMSDEKLELILMTRDKDVIEKIVCSSCLRVKKKEYKFCPYCGSTNCYIWKEGSDENK